MYEYLQDMEFLTALDKAAARTHYARIILLSFDEKPMKEIQGTITSGNLSVNGSSAVRRTLSLSMLASFDNANIEDVENEISLNKKIIVQVGLKNPFKEYAKYGDIIWFKCGMFIISSASVSRSTSGWSISITAKDKMCLLDGSVGGMLPATTVFHEKLVELDSGDVLIQQPTLYQIIYEAVNHWGGESIENIIITDVDDTVKMLVRYMGDEPIYFSNNYESMSFVRNEDFPHMISYGEDAGYKETSFTYPGELILNAGDTVVTLLNKIKDVLGNYEFYYDIDGHFIFQEIKNYLNTGSPLELTELELDNYVRNYNNAKFLYSLTDLDETTSIQRSPKYDNVKNDFYVWGTRNTLSGVEVDIRYHLAIDTKPDIDLANQYMWELRDSETQFIVRYEFTMTDTLPAGGGYEMQLIAKPCQEWREELYRRALLAQVSNSVYDNYYDSELLAEWRGLYDTMREDWNDTDHWNPSVFQNPGALNFWLDFIDTGSAIGKYSINEIGRRTKVINNKDLHTVYNKEVPDVVFLEGLDNDLIAQYQNIGQRYFVLTQQNYDLFSVSTTGASCFDKIREMLYQNLCYNTTITVSCLPKYYIEPNNIIYIEDKESGISGNFQIVQYSLPLTYNGTMSITATEALTRV